MLIVVRQESDPPAKASGESRQRIEKFFDSGFAEFRIRECAILPSL